MISHNTFTSSLWFSIINIVCTFFDQVMKSYNWPFLSSLLFWFCNNRLSLWFDLSFLNGKLLPFFRIIGFHPVRNLQEASIIISNQMANIVLPRISCNASELVHSTLNCKAVADFKFVDWICHRNFPRFVHEFRWNDFKD